MGPGIELVGETKWVYKVKSTENTSRLLFFGRISFRLNIRVIG